MVTDGDEEDSEEGETSDEPECLLLAQLPPDPQGQHGVDPIVVHSIYYVAGGNSSNYRKLHFLEVIHIQFYMNYMWMEDELTVAFLVRDENPQLHFTKSLSLTKLISI